MNVLVALPSEIGDLPAIEILNLHMAGLQSVPPELGNLHNLQILSLGGNDIHGLPRTFRNLKADIHVDGPAAHTA